MVKSLDILRKIFDAGVVGAGGAGFPTHKKLNCKVEYFIINGAECEPLLKTDQFIMQTQSEKIVEAAQIIGEMLEAQHVIFALKKKYIKETQALKEAITKLGANIEFFYLDGIYPAGDEQIIVHEVTGRTVIPGGIPLSVNTVVSNVTTLFNVYEALNGRAVTSRYITMIGEVKRPSIISVPIGISVKDCIDAVGGAAIDEYKVIMGGPMMGKFIDKEQISNTFITKTDGGIILIPEDHYLVRKSTISIEHMINQAKSACIQCSYCTDMCPRYLIGHKLRPHRVMRAMAINNQDDQVLEDALICCECGICELYACPMGISPRKMNIHVKSVLRSKGVKYTDTEIYTSNTQMKDFRQIPVTRLIPRIDMKRLERNIAFEALEVKADCVNIRLKQHIGNSASPMVGIGDKVIKGQLIANVDYAELGANIHSSVDGIVEEVDTNFIKITGSVKNFTLPDCSGGD